MPDALNSPGRWAELAKIHGLTQRDFQWLKHLELASQALRSEQNPPLLAERILLTAANETPIALAGCFVLSPSPQTNGVIVYTPYAGIQKFYSRQALTEQLTQRLIDANEDDDLLALMSLAGRKTLVASANVRVTYEIIDGDVFDDQRRVVADNQQSNHQAMLDELAKLPTLASLLDEILDESLRPRFADLDQRKTRVNIYSVPIDNHSQQGDEPTQRWHDSLTLRDAVLQYFRQQRWQAGQTHTYSHPKSLPASTDQQHWETAVQRISGKLLPLLFQRLELYWQAPMSGDGSSRRVFFSRAIEEQARAEILLKRETQIITPEQSQALQMLFQAPVDTPRRPTLETVRLWEQPANYVELAGSLMISRSSACLYTPTQGLQVLKDYEDLQATLLSKFSASGHEDELYGLLSLDERNRFIGFDRPNVGGEVIYGPIFATLFEAIITKQRQNIEYALQVFRHSDGAVNIHALFDKALDIRSMISERMLSLDAHGRWSTRPVLVGNQQPSAVRADAAAAYVKTFTDVEAHLNTDFIAQPLTSLAQQRVYLEHMKPRLAHALSVGLRGEASLRVLDEGFRALAQAIVDTVFNPDKPDRDSRNALNGFRPDAYALVLQGSGQQALLPLANCVLLTERGGLDNQHSGRVVVWSPASGLEVFDSIDQAQYRLNRRLLDPRKRLDLLENLPPAQHPFHQRYSINGLRLIEGNVLQHLMQSSIEHVLAASESIRARKLADAKQRKALAGLAKTGIDTNLRRATRIANAVSCRQSLPAWLGMAPAAEQQLQIELLEQYRHSVDADNDYLHGIQTLADYTRERLRSLLDRRFPGQSLDPDAIEITPDLALAGPARTLTEFALNHINIAQGTGFNIGSNTRKTLPAALNQAAVQQLLQSLNIHNDFATLMAEKLTGADRDLRKRRFARQLPWQLLQHAHALKLQQRLSAGAFDLICQVMDMPDAIARAAVEGAHAIVRPLELIKTAGTAAIKTLGLYLISPGAGHRGAHVLYAPFYAGSIFSEFENEASVVAAITAPGALQELVIRRLPDNQQSIFSNLFKATLGKPSEVTLASSPLDGNLLDHLFNDNVRLLQRMLGSQSQVTGQSDWESVKHLFSSGIKLAAGMLPGKLAYVQFLWQSFKDFDASAEALQDHHWKRALESFIAGSAQMISLGRLALEEERVTAPVTTETAPVANTVTAPKWSEIKPTAATRTSLQTFEAPTVHLKDLHKKAEPGLYIDAVSQQHYAPVAGKVYRVDKPGAVWQMLNASQRGPSLATTSNGQMVIDPDVHAVHYGKALSTLHNKYVVSHEVRRILNVEARGMEDIRAKHPEKARMIVQAIDTARLYAFNSLHNLAQQRQLASGTRLDTFFKHFFDVSSVDAVLLEKIRQAILPICTALVDPDEDLMNTERFVVGSSNYQQANLIAFVVNQDTEKRVHFTERFFDQQLDWYKSCLTEPFNVDGHSQAATLIHEFSHVFSKTVDIATLEARRPFIDLVAPITGYGRAMKQTQMDFQREALSLLTPREELFARWDDRLQSWVSLDSIPGMTHIGQEILKVAGTSTMTAARDAFFNRQDAEKRIDIILRNADSIAFLICEMGRQLDPVSAASAVST
jgi:hypothetical protein